MWFGLLACLLPAPAAGTEGLEVRQAELRLGERAVLAAREAHLDAEGRGEAREIRADLRSSTEAPPLEISAPRSSWDLKAREVRFSGGVELKRGDARMTCQEMVVRFREPGQLEAAEATGEVRFQQGERRARAERASLDGPSGRVELLGHPELEEGPHRMAGQRVILWLDQERVECEDCRLVVEPGAIGAGG
jgi:lipopolysaccharide export system protein LptA